MAVSTATRPAWFKRLFSPSEKRASNPDPFWYTLLETPGTSAGQAVTEHSALQVTAVYSCVRLLSSTIAQMPLHVYRREGDGRARVDGHPLDRLLNLEPSDWAGAFEFRRLLLTGLLLYGNGYGWLRRTPDGRVVEIVPCHPLDISMQYASLGPFYVWQAGQQSFVPPGSYAIPAGDMLHLRGLSTDGETGLSVIGNLAREATGLAQAQAQQMGRMMANGARPSMVLEHPGNLSADASANLAASVQAANSGANAGRPMVLEEGMKATPWAIPPAELQLLESRRFSVEEICRAFGVPPHLVGAGDQVSYASSEQANIEFLTYGLAPYLRLVENELDRKALPAGEQSTRYTRHVTAGLLRADTKSRHEAYSVALSAGWLSINEVRALEELPAIPDGDLHLVPLNMTIPEGVLASVEAQKAQATAPPASPPPAPTPIKGGGTPQMGTRYFQDLRELLPDITVRDAPEHAHETRAAEPEAEADDSPDAELRGDRQAVIRALEPVFGEAAARLTRREVRMLKEQLDAWLQMPLAERSEAISAFYGEFRQYVPPAFASALKSAQIATAASVKREVGRKPAAAELADFAAGYLETLAGAWIGNSSFQVRDALTAPEQTDAERGEAFAAMTAGWQETRPPTVGRDQSSESVNALAVAGYAAVGVAYLRWHTVGSNCPHCGAMRGRVTDIRVPFLEAGGTLHTEAGPFHVNSRRRHAPLHDGCDCLTFAA